MTKTKGAKTHTSAALQRVLGKVSPQELRRTEQRMLLAAKIADAIEDSGLSKSEFAERLGKHPSEITKWLSGTHNFTVDTLTDIQHELGIRLLETEQPAYKVVFSACVAVEAPQKTEWLYESNMDHYKAAQISAWNSMWLRHHATPKRSLQQASVCYYG